MGSAWKSVQNDPLLVAVCSRMMTLKRNAAIYSACSCGTRGMQRPGHMTLVLNGVTGFVG